jgi:hypothetical protein
MPFDRFLIAPINTGLETDVKQWQIMDDAFTNLENAYVFRGRVRKRFGTQVMVAGQDPQTTRLRINIGNTPGPINVTQTDNAANKIQIGQTFTVGTDVFTVVVLGAAAALLSTNTGATATINTTVTPNTITFTGEPGGTAVYWYPSFPVMGLTQYESGAINNHPSYAFDTRFAYVFTAGTGWNRSGTGANPIWHGTNLQYFQICNWKGVTANLVAMFVTNFNATINAAPAATDDPIWTTQDGSTWTNYSALIIYRAANDAANPGAYVATARIIINFKNRLLLLNTIENTGGAPADGNNYSFVNRCRYSANASPFAVNAWYEPNQKDGAGNVSIGAGFIDATTDEAIVSAEFIKDRLVVYFERSTWELVYTGNEVLPFVWQKINTELGSQALQSTVPFDTQVLTIGNTGVHACSGANVQRIDQKIPQYVFDLSIYNNQSNRISGIRDYIQECVYWSVSTDNFFTTQPFTNQILLYNYRNNSWATNDDCFTTYGYLEQTSAPIWQTSTQPWEQSNFTWNSGVTEIQRQIIAGTPEGYVLIINPNISRNAPAMYITNVLTVGIETQLTIINHNFATGDYILIENTQGITGLNGNVYWVIVIDANTINLRDINNVPPVFTGVYTGDGTGARVSVINIQTKQFNPYDKEDTDLYLQKVDFAVEKTSNGQVFVDYYPSSTQQSMVGDGEASGALTGTNILETSPYDPTFYPLEQLQERLWHPIYFQTFGECVQLVITYNEDQIFNTDYSLEDFQLEAFCLYTQKTSRRME